CNSRIGAWDNADAQPVFATVADETKARVGNPGRTGVRPQHDGLPLPNFLAKLGSLFLFIEVVVADQRLLDAVVVQQLQCLTCVFAGNEIGGAQRLERTWTDVRQVSDRSSYDDERTHEQVRLATV